MVNKKLCKILCAGLIILSQASVYAQSNTSFINTGNLQFNTSQSQNSVEFGFGNISKDSYGLGEYSSLIDQGGFMIGNVFLRSDAWTVKGLNLGLSSRSFFAEYKQQGAYSFYADYDQIPQYQLNNASTPFLNAGSSNQTLPTNWVAANTTAGMTNLLSNLQFHDLETERQRFAGGFSWLPADRWEFSGRYQHEVKEGKDLLAGIFGTNGGNPRGALLIQPIDYIVDDYTLSLAYADRRAQFSLAYNLSQFNNDNHSLIWSNPFLRLPAGNTWAPGTDYAAGAQGQLSLMPDNQAQLLTVSGAYSFANTARLNVNISAGQMQQDDTFLPYTINPTLAVLNALPRTQLDGEIDTLFINLGFSVRPTQKLNISARYTFDNRDNNTPRSLYLLANNDSANQGALLSASARTNTPYGFEIQKFRIDATYQLVSAHKLIIGFDQEQRDRTFTEVETTDENTVRIKLQSRLSDRITGHIEVAQADREGSEYISNKPFLEGHSPDYIATLPDNSRYINDPLLRKYNYADRTQQKMAAAINVILSDALTLAIATQKKENEYTNSKLGLQQSDESSSTLNITYSASTSLDSYFFFTREAFIKEQAGYQRAATILYPGIIREPPLCASCGFWNVAMDDDIDTAGTGLNWETWEERLKLGIAYTYSKTLTRTLANADANVAYAPLPEINTRLQSLNATADYSIKENMELRLRYLHQKERMRDFAVDNVSPNTMGFIIYPAGERQGDSVYVIGLSFIYKY